MLASREIGEGYENAISSPNFLKINSSKWSHVLFPAEECNQKPYALLQWSALSRPDSLAYHSCCARIFAMKEDADFAILELQGQSQIDFKHISSESFASLVTEWRPTLHSSSSIRKMIILVRFNMTHEILKEMIQNVYNYLALDSQYSRFVFVLLESEEITFRFPKDLGFRIQSPDWLTPALREDASKEIEELELSLSQFPQDRSAFSCKKEDEKKEKEKENGEQKKTKIESKEKTKKRKIPPKTQKTEKKIKTSKQEKEFQPPTEERKRTVNDYHRLIQLPTLLPAQADIFLHLFPPEKVNQKPFSILRWSPLPGTSKKFSNMTYIWLARVYALQSKSDLVVGTVPPTKHEWRQCAPEVRNLIFLLEMDTPQNREEAWEATEECHVRMRQHAHYNFCTFIFLEGKCTVPDIGDMITLPPTLHLSKQEVQQKSRRMLQMCAPHIEYSKSPLRDFHLFVKSIKEDLSECYRNKAPMVKRKSNAKGKLLHPKKKDRKTGKEETFNPDSTAQRTTELACKSKPKQPPSKDQKLRTSFPQPPFDPEKEKELFQETKTLSLENKPLNVISSNQKVIHSVSLPPTSSELEMFQNKNVGEETKNRNFGEERKDQTFASSVFSQQSQLIGQKNLIPSPYLPMWEKIQSEDIKLSLITFDDRPISFSDFLPEEVILPIFQKVKQDVCQDPPLEDNKYLIQETPNEWRLVRPYPPPALMLKRWDFVLIFHQQLKTLAGAALERERELKMQLEKERSEKEILLKQNQILLQEQRQAEQKQNQAVLQEMRIKNDEFAATMKQIVEQEQENQRTTIKEMLQTIKERQSFVVPPRYKHSIEASEKDNGKGQAGNQNDTKSSRIENKSETDLQTEDVKVPQEILMKIEKQLIAFPCQGGYGVYIHEGGCRLEYAVGKKKRKTCSFVSENGEDFRRKYKTAIMKFVQRIKSCS